MANQRLSSESQPGSGDSSKVGIHEKESQLSTRLREVIGDESVASFSRRCGIGDSTLRKYIDGAVPNSINLVAMADSANVNIEWLAAGRGPKMRGASASIPMIPPAPPIPASIINVDDIKRLEMAMEAVEEGMGDDFFEMSISKRAKLIAATYDLLIDMDQKDNIAKFIKRTA